MWTLESVLCLLAMTSIQTSTHEINFPLCKSFTWPSFSNYSQLPAYKEKPTDFGLHFYLLSSKYVMIIEWTSHKIALRQLREEPLNVLCLAFMYELLRVGTVRHTRIQASTYVHICTYNERYRDNRLQFHSIKISIKRLQCVWMCVHGHHTTRVLSLVCTDKCCDQIKVSTRRTQGIVGNWASDEYNLTEVSRSNANTTCLTTHWNYPPNDKIIRHLNENSLSFPLTNSRWHCCFHRLSLQWNSQNEVFKCTFSAFQAMLTQSHCKSNFE